MNSISWLREVLIRALTTSEPEHDEQELFEQLMIQKPRLLKLLDVGPRNPQEQREVESGKITINGKSVAVNSDFARQVIFLSQQLDCSERYVARLLHDVMLRNPNLAPVNCMENTVADFHLYRRHLVDSLRYLLDGAEVAEVAEVLPTYTRLAKFTRDLLGDSGSGSGESAVASGLVKEIEKLDVLIGRADIARRSAGSNTIAPSDQGNPQLGCDALNSRYESLNYERRYLATSLCSISRLGFLSVEEIKHLVDLLSTNPAHPLLYYILTAIFLAFDPFDPSCRVGSSRQMLATDNSLLVYMAKKFAPSTSWREPGLKATLLLKWTMFLTETRHNDASLEHRTGFTTEELEIQVWNAVQGDAFGYLAYAVVHLQRKHGSVPAASLVNYPPAEQEQRETPPDDFKLTVISTFETLVRSLITHASSELRKIKQRQEDLVLASARTERNRVPSRFGSSLAPEADKASATPRQDIAMLYSFIGLLYAALPTERALQFWGAGPSSDSHRVTYLEYVESTSGRLPAFLQWAIWSTSVQDLTMLAALYDMLSGLAKGQQCSELAYNFMARGGEILPGRMGSSSSTGPSVSWTVIFSLLESWAASASNPRGQAQPQPLGISQSFGSLQNYAAPPPAAQQVTIGPKDVLLSQSFLRLLSTVVTYSVAVRTAISGHAHFRAIPTLISLIPLGIPLELKGALFETLSAFCEPGAGAPGVEICKAVWTLMERLEVINVRAGSTSGFSMALATSKGVELELEQIESVHRLYPATIPFLKLLSTAIHTSKRMPLSDQAAGLEPSNTIPESLGQPYRIPGLGPFTSFVIDIVFANIPNREYAQPSDRWKTNDLCLCYIERALASFNLESLVAAPEDVPIKGESLVPLLIHPGYDIMKRLLTNSPLQSSLLTYIIEGIGGFEKDVPNEEPFFLTTMIRVLRIVHRVLEIQDIFLDVLIPLLSDFNNSATFVGQVNSRSSFTRFDQALSFGPQYAPALAAYMTFATYSEVVLLSIKIITILSTSTFFSNLVALVERSGDSDRILGGFMHVIGSESMEDVLEAEAVTEQITGAGAPDNSEIPDALKQATRLAALDLLIQDTASHRPYPNIAHFLLFGSVNGEYQIQDPHALGAQRTSIHVLLDLVNAGVPRSKGKRKEQVQEGAQVEPLFKSLPALAERCYHVVYQLCVHPRTSEFTMRYLRTREDFFARQLARVPSQAPLTLQEPPIQVIYGDGSRIITTVTSLSSFIRLRSFIFDLVALELHVLTSRNHFKGVLEILEILFGTDFEYEEEYDFPTFHEVGQSQMRIIDFFQSLTFEWSDSLSVEPVTLQFLAQFNLQACVRKDAAGCEIVDRIALLQLLAAAKRALHAQGSIVTAAHGDQLSRETTYILESCAVENHRRKVSHSLVSGFEAWRRLLDLALTKCFDRLPHDHRENMLFDLLHVLPAAIRSPNIEVSTAVLLSETVLSLITKLREDRQQHLILQSAGGDTESGSLPAERLYNILRNVLQGILDNNHLELVRGNLYAALINFIHLIGSPNETQLIEAQRKGFSMSFSTTGSDSLISSSQALVPLDKTGRSQSYPSSLESGCLAVMKPTLERLVTAISRDAIDGTEVWKTVAFMLLDATVQLSGLEKQHIVLSVLNRHGILSNFVHGIKEADTRLQSVLKPDPDDLNPLYVYEAKMSLFIRMAQTRSGAERLLDSQLIPILAQCDYLDARPEADQTFLDQDSFLPSAVQRYHQLFMPALQVIDAITVILGSKHTTASKQAQDFLLSHGATITILLKNQDEYLTSSLLEEIHLILTLCSNVLPSVPSTELLSPNSGFGAIHAAILSLSTRYLIQGRGSIRVIPQTDQEHQAAKTRALGFASESKFDVSVRRKQRLLRKSMVTYIGAASNFTEPEITLVLSPITLTPRRDDRDSHFSATVPTVGDTLAALDDLCNDLGEVLKQISDISAELSNKEHIGLDSAEEILRDIDSSLLQDLDVEQKRVLICQEFERMQRIARMDAKVLLDTTEMLLLLIWRHLEYYSQPRYMNAMPVKVSVSNAMRLLATAEPEAFRAEMGAKLAPALERLASLDLDYQSFGQDWQGNQGYIEIMCRRLRDSAGLHDETVQGRAGG